MKISEKYKIKKEDYDFLDVNVDKDNYFFIDPYLFDVRKDCDEFCNNCYKTMHNFFTTFLTFLSAGNETSARNNFSKLTEPNNVKLGMSKDKPDGNGIGTGNINAIFEAIKETPLFLNGVVDGLEDIKLFIKYVDIDKLSDMSVNIIASELADFTLQQCNKYGIPTKEFEISFWNTSDMKWDIRKAQLPVDNDDNYLLFVPKKVVTKRSFYSFGDYLWKSLLVSLKEELIKKRDKLVVFDKRNDKCHISKVKIYKEKKDEFGFDKKYAVAITSENPDLLKKFKKDNLKRVLKKLNK